MWETIKDLLLVGGRIVTILPLLLATTLFMGKRSIGELPVFDFLIIIALGAVVGADIADPNIEHIPTAFAIIVIGLVQRVVSTMAIKHRKFGRAITFEPTVVVSKGNMLVDNLRKVNYSIDNILQMLREKDIFHLGEVELAILEANGRLSVYKNPKSAPITSEDLGLVKPPKGVAYPLILEGTVSDQVLAYLHKDNAWLAEQLLAQGINKNDVFYASVDENLTLHVSRTSSHPVPPIHH